MHDFQLHVPTTLAEAQHLLDRYGEEARLLGGGTALVQLMKQRLSQPQHLVALAQVPGLTQIERRDGHMRIGALATLWQVETAPLVQEHAPLLAETLGHVATVRIRNMATVGGCLGHGDPNQDPPPSLIALGAWARLSSSRGERDVAIEDLYRDYFETSIGPGEVVTQLVVPSPWGSCAYLKFLPRTADDYATVSVAVQVSREGGVCREARIALGSVGPIPVRARRAEDLLRGQAPTTATLRAAAEAAAEQTDPLDDVRGSASYKREMAAVFTRRALEQAFARTGGREREA